MKKTYSAQENTAASLEEVRLVKARDDEHSFLAFR